MEFLRLTCWTNPSALLNSVVVESFLAILEMSDLPFEIVSHIFGILDVPSLVRASATCQPWREVSNDARLWRAIFYESVSLMH